jgi:GntR family transcriptional regulator/MocR family aminotransferase
MPVARRHALVEWAHRARAFVFEDDYDGEFRYAGQPIPALAGLDPDAVIYCGTFSKSLFPACRMGYLVLPPSLVGAALSCKWISDRGSSRLIERAIAGLLRSGDYDRHIRRMQRRYRERRDVLIRSLPLLRARRGDRGQQRGPAPDRVAPELPASRARRRVEMPRAGHRHLPSRRTRRGR